MKISLCGAGLRTALSFFLSLCLASCQRSPLDGIPGQGVTVSVNVVGVGPTKATGVVASSDENAVNDVQVIVFDARGDADGYACRDSEGTVEVATHTGAHEVWALTNFPSLELVRDKDEFLSLTASLSDESLGNLVHVACWSGDVTMGWSRTLQLEHLLSRVTVGKVTNALSVETLSSQEFRLLDIYLTNVPASADLSVYADGTTSAPAAWYNKRGLRGELDRFLHDAVASADQVVALNTSHAVRHCFYSLPNVVADDSRDAVWCPRRTRLVVKGSIGGQVYFWPVTLPVMESNVSYDVSELIIERMGVLDEETELPYAVFTFDASPEGFDPQAGGLSFVSREMMISFGGASLEGYVGEAADVSLLSPKHFLEVNDVAGIGDVTSSVTVASVVSYTEHANGTRVSDAWGVEFSEDGGESWSATRPSWLSAFTASGSGGYSGEPVGASATSRTTGTLTQAGTFGAAVGSSSSYADLSLIHPLTRAAVPRETANCYVVTAPGYYRIPLIYGAAVVNGSDNLSAAAPAGTFKNAFGNNIGSADIATDVGAANLGDAHLEWQTAAGLVSVEPELELDGGVYYLKFQVPAATIREGSALVGVLKDGSSDEYVWSWLIWVVSGEMAMGTDTYTNAASLDIDMLNWPLGGTRTPNTGKPARSCMVKISNAYAERTFTLSQEAVVTSTGNPVCTYYQWGMPCALPPDGTLYDAAGSTYTFNYDSGNSVANVAGTISKPQLPRWENGHLGTAYNNWDADMSTGSSDQPVNKTVYDPSPAGFSVPRYAFATGFSTANVVGSFNKGYTFKRTTSDTEGRFWGACGRRVSGTSVDYAGSYGFFWSAAAFSGNSGYRLYFFSGSVYPQDLSNRFCSFVVRSAVWPE